MPDPTKRTGFLEGVKDAKGRFVEIRRAFVRLADGSRKGIPIPLGSAERTDEVAARLLLLDLQRAEDERGELLAAKLERVQRVATAEVRAGLRVETCDEFYARYHAYQVDLGHTDAVKKRSRWRKWIAPHIGSTRITKVTRDNIEDVRDALDRAIERWKRAGKSGGKKDRAISGKTAMNAWSALTSSFKAATSSKRRDLRVLDGKPNPCLGVEPPGDRNSRKARRKPFVYPKECAVLLACEAVPRAWRELHAVAAYTALRPGELRVLTFGDVDLDAGLIHVTKAWDYSTGAIKPPKTRNGVRRVPIEPTLRPLLERMGRGKEKGALVVPVLSTFRGGRAAEDQLAPVFREHLEAAGVDRAELHTTTATAVQANFRSWRDSGLTWLAMSGLGVDKIMRRAGHDMVQTTMGYVKQAEDLTGDLGTPFGPLPPELLEDAAAALAGSKGRASTPKAVERPVGASSMGAPSDSGDTPPGRITKARKIQAPPRPETAAVELDQYRTTSEPSDLHALQYRRRDSNPAEEAQVRELTHAGASENMEDGHLSSRASVSEHRPDYFPDQCSSHTIDLPDTVSRTPGADVRPWPDRTSAHGPELAQLAAKARMLERLLRGRDEQLLAAELRDDLERLAGPLAEVVPFDAKRSGRS